MVVGAGTANANEAAQQSAVQINVFKVVFISVLFNCFLILSGETIPMAIHDGVVVEASGPAATGSPGEIVWGALSVGICGETFSEALGILPSGAVEVGVVLVVARIESDKGWADSANLAKTCVVLGNSRR